MSHEQKTTVNDDLKSYIDQYCERNGGIPYVVGLRRLAVLGLAVDWQRSNLLNSGFSNPFFLQFEELSRP